MNQRGSVRDRKRVRKVHKRVKNRLAPLASLGTTVGQIPDAIRTSRTTRYSFYLLSGVLAYLLIGQAVDPGFTHYWWYQLVQTSATQLVVLLLDAAFANEGGMAWQTHAIVIVATLADTLGTAGHMYARWGPYDKVVHFSSGAAFAAASYQTLWFLKQRGEHSLSNRAIVVISIGISLGFAGVLWETYEYLGDQLFASGRQYGWSDTIGDCIADFCGAVTAVLIMSIAASRRRNRFSLTLPASAQPHVRESTDAWTLE